MASRNFGTQLRPVGKEFRDTGSLGRAVSEIYKDVDAAFETLEAELGTLPSTSAVEIKSTRAETDIGDVTALVPANVLPLENHFSGRIAAQTAGIGGENLNTDTAAAILAELAGRKGSAAAVGDTWQLWVRNTTGAADTITLVGGVGVTATGLGSTLVLAQNEAALFEFQVTGIGGGAAIDVRRIA